MSIFKLEIQEYGKTVRTYSDSDRAKFLAEVARMMDDHLKNRSAQSGNEVKNITFHVFTVQ